MNFYEEIQNNEIYKTLAKNALLVKELYSLSDDEIFLHDKHF